MSSSTSDRFHRAVEACLYDVFDGILAGTEAH